jgi:D-glycero-alpha-D-manno-heptose 1-phosphate guanylyltransferase
VTEAIILAGGLGTRLRDTVPDLPKPLAPINGRPFLEYQMDYWIAQSVTRFVLSVGFRREKIIEHFGNEYRGCEVAYAEEFEPLGTGGGLLLAVQKLKGDGPFLAMNGDTFFEVDLASLSSFHQKQGATVTVGLFNVTNNDRYMEVQLNADGTVASFKSAPGASQLANGGVYLMNRNLFEELPWAEGAKLSLEDDLFEHCRSSGKKLCGMVYKGKFIDIGVPADYHRAATVIKNGWTKNEVR